MKIIPLSILAVATCAGFVWFSWTPIEHLSRLDGLQVQSGYQQMAKHRVVICGIIRDNANALPVVIKHIEHTGKHFADYSVIIFENDSKDGTKEILQSWQLKNPKVQIISKDFGNKKRFSLSFLADIRNLYLDKLFSGSRYQDFDMVMVVDMDMLHGWDMRGVADSFAKIDKWDAVCSNGIENAKGVMYDLSAFRSKAFPYQVITWKECYQKYGQACLQVYPVGGDLVPVQSGFGGMAFYKKQYLKGCRYSSANNGCEHVPFHACVTEKNGGRMVLNPSQVIRYVHYEPLMFMDIPIILKTLYHELYLLVMGYR